MLSIIIPNYFIYYLMSINPLMSYKGKCNSIKMAVEKGFCLNTPKIINYNLTKQYMRSFLKVFL